MRRSWTGEDVARLRAMVAANASRAEIGAAFGLAGDTVGRAMQRHGLTGQIGRWDAAKLARVRAMVAEGAKVSAIARALGISVSALCKAAKAHGFDIGAKRFVIWDEASRAELAALYAAGGSFAAIGQRFGITTSAARSAAVHHGVHQPDSTFRKVRDWSVWEADLRAWTAQGVPRAEQARRIGCSLDAVSSACVTRGIKFPSEIIAARLGVIASVYMAQPGARARHAERLQANAMPAGERLRRQGIPDDRHAEYRLYRAKGWSADEARSEVLQAIARDEIAARQRAALTPRRRGSFADELARVASGQSRVVVLPVMVRGDVAGTIGCSLENY